MIKIGLIGAGFMGSTHGAAYQNLAGKYRFQVTAVADLDPNRAKQVAEKFGAAIYKTGEELIANADVNTVDICLPTYLHAGHAIKAMEKGLNALVEKPVCREEAEAQALLKAHRETNTQVMVAQCIRFWDEYVYLKKLIDSKEFGAFCNAAFTRVSPRPEWAWEGWLHDPQKSGSAALDLHIHDVDYVRYLFGDPERLQTEISYRDGNAEHIFALYRYGEKVVTLEGGWDYPGEYPFEMAYRVNFEEASVVFSSCQKPTVKVYPFNGSVFSPEFSGYQAESGVSGGNIASLGGYYNEIRYFLESLTTGRDIENATLEEAVESFRLAMKEIEKA